MRLWRQSHRSSRTLTVQNSQQSLGLGVENIGCSIEETTDHDLLVGFAGPDLRKRSRCLSSLQFVRNCPPHLGLHPAPSNLQQTLLRLLSEILTSQSGSQLAPAVGTSPQSLPDEVVPLSADLRGRLRAVTVGCLCLTCLQDFSEWGSRQRKSVWRTRSQSQWKAWDITSRPSGSPGSIVKSTEIEFLIRERASQTKTQHLVMIVR